MKLQGEAVYLGGRYSEPTDQFPEGSWFATFADEEGNTFKIWARGGVLPVDPPIGSLTRCDLVCNYREVDAFGQPGSENYSAAKKSLTLIECRPKAGK
jgi:hypothetical protein